MWQKQFLRWKQCLEKIFTQKFLKQKKNEDKEFMWKGKIVKEETSKKQFLYTYIFVTKNTLCKKMQKEKYQIKLICEKILHKKIF